MTAENKIAPHPTPWRARVYRVVFETDTPAGKLFDALLLVAILASVVAVSLETVRQIPLRYLKLLAAIEWCFTILFTLEYLVRLVCVRRPMRYARSFFGVIDLISFLPTYISMLLPGTKLLVVLRSMRLLRVFRVFELWSFDAEAKALGQAMWRARAKIVVFLMTVLIAVTIAGTAMYVVEHDRQGSMFTSIPQSIYWAVVTMTTVGYGDVVPQTTEGKLLSVVLILLGYSLIIVPTGFVSAEMVARATRREIQQECPKCFAGNHQEDARYCRRCRAELPLRT